MSSIVAAGTFPCRVVTPAIIGASDELDAEGRAIMFARVNIELTAGPDKGKRMTWEEQLSSISIKYARRSLIAVGWKGHSFGTVATDIKVGAETVAEIAHFVIKKGKRAGESFAKVRNLGSGERKLEDADLKQVAELDALMRADFEPGSFDDGEVG